MRRKARKKVDSAIPPPLANIQHLQGYDQAVSAGCTNVHSYLGYCRETGQEPTMCGFAEFFTGVLSIAVVNDQLHVLNAFENAVVAGCAYAHWQIEQESQEGKE